MASSASNRPVPPPRIFVVDTSALIRFKSAVKLGEQWQLLTAMRRLVEEGYVAFPKQVAKEMAAAQHPDAPGAWMGDVRRKCRYPEPTDDALADVLDVAERLVEAEAIHEVADPFVVAMACDLADRYAEQDIEVVVVSEDTVDRLPHKLSILTACERVEIGHWQLEAFLDWLRDQLLDEDI